MKNKIAISICTCKRPVMLSNALNGVKNLELPDDAEVILIVVDNDVEETAKAVVEKFKSELKIETHYFVEPTRGLSSVRNRVLKEALNLNATELALFDDDAIPDRLWIKNLFELYKNSDADIVTGPQIHVFPEKTPGFIKNNSVFKIKHRKTGTYRDLALTNNVIFPTRLITDFNLWFNEKFNFTSGEDIDFFKRAYKSGARIIWSEEAIIREEVPKSRLTLSWILRRQFRRGIEGSASLIKEGFTPKILINKKFHKILFRLVGYFLLLLVSWILGPTYFVEILSKTSKSLGRIAAIWGVKIYEYKEIHGY